MDYPEYAFKVVMYMKDNFHPPENLDPVLLVERICKSAAEYFYVQNLSDEMAGEFIAYDLKLTRRTNKEN